MAEYNGEYEGPQHQRKVLVRQPDGSMGSGLRTVGSGDPDAPENAKIARGRAKAGAAVLSGLGADTVETPVVEQVKPSDNPKGTLRQRTDTEGNPVLALTTPKGKAFKPFLESVKAIPGRRFDPSNGDDKVWVVPDGPAARALVEEYGLQEVSDAPAPPVPPEEVAPTETKKSEKSEKAAFEALPLAEQRKLMGFHPDTRAVARRVGTHSAIVVEIPYAGIKNGAKDTLKQVSARAGDRYGWKPNEGKNGAWVIPDTAAARVALDAYGITESVDEESYGDKSREELREHTSAVVMSNRAVSGAPRGTSGSGRVYRVGYDGKTYSFDPNSDDEYDAIKDGAISDSRGVSREARQAGRRNRGRWR